MSVWVVPSPAATLTAISLLTKPASADSAILAKTSSPEEVWNEVYCIVGYNAKDYKVSRAELQMLPCR